MDTQTVLGVPMATATIKPLPRRRIMTSVKPDEVGLIIPKWFIAFVAFSLSTFIATFLPWAVWMTAGMMTVQAKVSQVDAGILPEADKRISLIQADLHRLESRIERIEKKP